MTLEQVRATDDAIAIRRRARRLSTIIDASDVDPTWFHVSAVPAGLQQYVQPHAVEGWVAIPTVRRAEEPWPRGRVPAWFSASVPGKPPWRWTREDGTVAPHYAELIVQDLLRQADWASVWVKYWGGKRRFWQGLGRRGPVEVDMPPAPATLIATIDAIVVEATGRRPSRRPPGGCWDIFAWRGSRRLFLEVKKPGEGFNENQPAWLAASLAAGVRFESFSVVEYVADR